MIQFFSIYNQEERATWKVPQRHKSEEIAKLHCIQLKVAQNFLDGCTFRHFKACFAIIAILLFLSANWYMWYVCMNVGMICMKK